ncbi:hypothetical protein M5I08_09570 [Candidatus Mycobacterium methanotrophicum]|uniref:PPE family C-terminal domain-containing protein n=2 Tax=Candidatus Mycobacterium methanotrophicum TaxID=2943498 RepID=A0ABY4QPQ1_9MYCO|nr:hypothetical protein M5I08_09570 [Candidatus Mycobacterium methanotrophicum]
MVSVPPSWATAAADAEPVAVSLTAAEAGAAPAAVSALPPGMAMQEATMGTMSGRGAVSGVTDDHDGNRGGKKQKGKEEKDGERSAAALVMASGWLAATLAYNARRPVGPAPDRLALPPEWEEELAANQSAWG